jgi:hypothetical protein
MEKITYRDLVAVVRSEFEKMTTYQQSVAIIYDGIRQGVIGLLETDGANLLFLNPEYDLQQVDKLAENVAETPIIAFDENAWARAILLVILSEDGNTQTRLGFHIKMKLNDKHFDFQLENTLGETIDIANIPLAYRDEDLVNAAGALVVYMYESLESQFRDWLDGKPGVIGFKVDEES